MKTTENPEFRGLPDTTMKKEKIDHDSYTEGLKDKLIEEVIDELKEDKVKLAEFQAGFIDHVFLMEKTFDKVNKKFEKTLKNIKKEILGKISILRDDAFINKTFEKHVGELK